VPGITVLWWLVPGLMVLGLLALGISAFSLHPRPPTVPQQHVTTQPPSAVPVVPDEPTTDVPGGKAYLGIRGKTFLQGQVQGVKVLNVFPDSPAARAGLRSHRDRAQGAGHVIIGVDGQSVRSEEDLAEIMAHSFAGDRVQLLVTNTTGKPSEVISVTLGTAPATPANSHGTVAGGPSLSSAPDLPVPNSRAELVPVVPWPEARLDSLQNGKRMSDALAKTLGRMTPVGWGGPLLSPPLQTVGSDPGEAQAASVEVSPALIDAYIDRLEIAPVQRTRLVKIAFSTPDPDLAARVANMHARAYLEQGIERRSHANEEARYFLQGKLAELKDRVEKSEATLHRYRRDKGIISLDNRDNIVVDRLADLNKRLIEAEVDRIGLEAQTHLIRKSKYDTLPAVINNSQLQALKGELARLEGQRADHTSQLQPGDPVLDQLRVKIEQTRQRLQQERRRTVAAVKSAYTAARQKEDELRAKMEQQKTVALSLKDAAVDYTILAREVDTNRQLYESVLQRLKEIEVATALRASNVSVIDQAVPPLQPSRPKKGLSLLCSAVLGLVGGVGLAFFVEYLNNTLRTSQEVERYLHLPSLGMIPDFVRSARHGSPSPEPANPEVQLLNGSAAQAGFVFTHSPFSVTTEAYRMLRTALLLAQAETSPKTLLFTSGMRGEGKTVTVVNTAAVLAQMGVRVLVIDADLRCSACHTILGVENKSGLADVLSGRWDPVDVIRPTVSDHLFVLSSGSLPLNPTELVGSKQMRCILAALQEQYDYVLIDSPPVMLASDAILLSTMVDGVVLVANAQRTPKQVVREARLRLSYARAKVLGVVLNQLDMRQREYAYYYRNYAPAA
jgi:capsular exopolysaccharide synthesis family protein